MKTFKNLKELAECFNVSISVEVYHEYAGQNWSKALLPSGEWEDGWDGGDVHRDGGNWSTDDERIGSDLLDEQEETIMFILSKTDIEELIDRKGSDAYYALCDAEKDGIHLFATLDWSPKNF